MAKGEAMSATARFGFDSLAFRLQALACQPEARNDIGREGIGGVDRLVINLVRPKIAQKR